MFQKNEIFDYLNITLKDNDKRYIVHSIRGEKEINIEKCFKMKNNQIEGIESIYQKLIKIVIKLLWKTLWQF